MVCRPRGRYVVIALVCLLGIAGPLSAATLHVDSSGKSGFSSIQAAVDASSDGDIIIVNPGTYAGRGNQDINLQRKAIRIQGSDPEDSSVVEATVIDCGGTESNPHRGFYVNEFAGEIAGLTITNGLASAGGAIYCRNSTLAVKQCRIVNNTTRNGSDEGESDGGPGGGIYCEASTLEIEDSVISGNATGAGADARSGLAGSGGDGGGVYSTASVLYVSNAIVSENTTGDGGNSEGIAGQGGNGAGIYGDSLVISGSQVIDNRCGQGGSGPQGGQGGDGAGVHCSRATIAASVIEGNQAGTGGESTIDTKGLGGLGGHGGGVLCMDSLDLQNSLIVGNRAGLAGGGDSSLAALSGRGGGVYCSYGVIDHCTIVGNAAFGDIVDDKASPLGSGGGVACAPQTAITNSILWGNTLDQIAGQDCGNVLYCDIQGGLCPDGRGNISVDPRFVDAGHWVDTRDTETVAQADDPDAVWANGDYHLADGSPCIDAADPEYDAASGETDLDGKGRVSGSAADMGAYEVHNFVTVYRFRSRQANKFFYAVGESEKDELVDRESATWELDGPAWSAPKSGAAAGLKPVYRFESDWLDRQVYTISETEKDRLLGQYGTQGWVLEGVGFYAYPQGSQPEEAKPVYRFWSHRDGGYFFTVDEAEKKEYQSDSGTWTFEGIAWYAFEGVGTGEDPQTPGAESSALYDFTAGSDAATYVVQLKAYIDGQQAQLDNATIRFDPALGRMQMVVDLDALTAEMTEFHVESGRLDHVMNVTLAEAGVVDLTVALSLHGFFDAMAARGPYAIDSRSLTFPTAAGSEAVSDEDTCQIVGSAVMDAGKFDVNLTLNPTEVDLDGTATVDDSDAPDRLEVRMDGLLQWNCGQQGLLLEAPLKGHTLQLYADMIEVRPAGLWQGKNLSQTEDERK